MGDIHSVHSGIRIGCGGPHPETRVALGTFARGRMIDALDALAIFYLVGTFAQVLIVGTILAAAACAIGIVLHVAGVRRAR